MTYPGTALYVPGDRPDRFGKAVASGATTVILDLQDAVAQDRKTRARDAVIEWLASGAAEHVDVQVRVNHPATEVGRADLGNLPSPVAIRLPRVASPSDVDAVLAAGHSTVHALIESAAGLEAAYAIASHPAVVSVGLGEADLRADLGVHDEAGLAWARSRTVVAARAAGLPAPMMAAYPSIPDLDGLAKSCARGRALGMRGRTAIHPRQLPTIAAAFRPTNNEIAWAQEVLARLADCGVAVLDDGSMVDEAMAKQARELLRLTEAPPNN